MSDRLCCIIPAFNEEKDISKVINGAAQSIKDIIVIDDGSTDSTAQQAIQAGAKVIRHHKNMGKGMALRSGFKYALDKGFDAVITLDADGQHSTDEIKGFISEYMNNSSDIVIGSRLWDKAAIPMYRYIPNLIGVFCISKAAGCRIGDSQSGFRLYRSDVLKKISLQTTGFETETEILIKAGRSGFKISSIPVSAIYNKDYNTKFKPVKDFYKISILVLKLSISKNRYEDASGLRNKKGRTG